MVAEVYNDAGKLLQKSLWPKVRVPGLCWYPRAGKDHSGHSFLARWHHPYNQGFHQMILTDVIFKLCWNAYICYYNNVQIMRFKSLPLLAFWAIISFVIQLQPKSR